jgi:Meiotically Up-regulated Gene 113 (MUG113) protein
VNKNPKVYLVKIVNDDKSLYKIGFTRGSIHKRIRELQTGCPYEILPVDTYLTDKGLIIEKSLHNFFSSKKTYGEWFELGIEEEVNFLKLCEKYERIQESLTKNKID